jgi:autotransporter-associated beta strand protein
MKKILLLLALFLLSVPAAQAAFTSNFTGANANMTLSGAWDNGVPASADTARWANATYTSSANVTANQAIGKLLFASTTGNVTFGTGASTLTLNGVGGIGIQVDSGSGTVITGGAKFALGASQEWITNSANATTVNGTITNSGNTTAYTLTINGTGNITLSGIISNGGTVGTTAIAKTGAGTLTLSGTNTYAGGVTLNSGKLILGSNAALGGAAGNFTINAGTTIDVSAARTTGSNNKQNWFGDFTFAGSNTWNTGTGAVTMNATRTATVVASTMTVGGNITDSGSGFGLTKAGAGTLALTGNNTYTGATTVSVGTLQFGKIVSLYGGNETSWTASNLVVESGATAAFNVGGTGEFTSANITTLAALGSGAGGFKSGAILGLDTTTTSFAYAGNIINPNSGSNVLGLVKLGTGTLTLSGTNTYSGNTTVSAGALSFANTAAMPSSGNVTVAAGATLGLGVGGSGYFSSANVTALWGNTLAHVTMNAASLVGIDTSAGNFTYSTAQSTRGLVKLGTNTLTLDQANTFTGGMTINEGTLKYGIANALATTGNVTVNANGASTTATLDLAGNNATIGTLTMGGAGGTSTSVSQVTTGAGTLTLGGNVTTDATGNPTTAASISGNLTLGANRTFTVADSTGSAIDLDVSAVVSGTGFNNLTKAGAGTMTLNGTNTYTGKTVISAGALSINSISDVGAGSSSLGNPTTTANGTIGIGATTAAGTLIYTGGGHSSNRTIDLAGTTGGATIQAEGAGALTLTSNFTTSAVSGNKTLTLTGNSTAANTIQGVIPDKTAGTAYTTLAKTGVGTWTLSGTNTYTGATTVTAGTLTVSGTLAGTSGVTVNGTSAVFNQTSTGAIQSGFFTLTNGTATLAGTNTYTGNTTINAGMTLVANNVSALGNYTISSVRPIAGSTLALATDASINPYEIVNPTSLSVVTIISDRLTPGVGITHILGKLSTGQGVLNITAGSNVTSGSPAVAFGNVTLTGTGGVIDSFNPTTASVSMVNVNMTPNGFTNNQTLTLDGTASGNTISGNITNVGGGTSTGFLTLIKSNTSTWTLSGNNTYTGLTTISGGTLVLSGNNTAATGNVAVNGGALVLSGSGIIGASTANLTLGGGSVDLGATSQTVGAVSITAAASSGATIGNGSLTGASYAASNTSGNATVSANLLGSAGLTKSGAGTLVLTGTNTYTGGTTVSAGILNFGTNGLGTTGNITLTGGTLQYAAAANTDDVGSRLRTSGANTLKIDVNNNAVTFGSALTAADIAGTGGLNLTSTAAGGSLTLTGTNTYTGLTTVTSGTLKLASAGGTIASGSNLTTAAGGTFDINGNDQTLGILQNGGTVTNSGASKTLTIGNASGGAGSFTGAMDLILNNGDTGSNFTGVTTLGMTGNLTLNVTGVGSITFGTANHTGTIANSGSGGGSTEITTVGSNVTSVTLNSLNSLLTATNLNVNSGGTTLTNNTAGTRVFTVTNSVSGTGNLILNNNSAVASGITLTGGADNTGSITNSGTGTGSTLITGAIGTNVTGGVIQNAAGTLAINGANTFTSGLTVTKGTVSSNQTASTAFGNGAISLGNTAGGNSDNAAILYTGTSTAVANEITVNAGSSGILSIQGQTNNATFTGGITLNNALTLAQLTAARTTTFSGAITGGSAINIGNTGITNAGTVILTNAGNSYSGGTAINSGTLEIGSSGNQTLSGTVSGTGAFVQSGTGTLTLTGTNTYTGATTIGTGAGALILSGTGTLNSGNYAATITNNGSLVYESSTDQILGGSIVGTGSITKNGTGRLTLSSSASSYSGGVTLNAGILDITNASGGTSALGNSATSVLTINGGSIDCSGPTARTYTNPIVLNADLNYISTTADIVFNSATTLNGTRSVTVGASWLLTMGGVISDGGSAYGLTKEGAGTLSLTGAANTYTGNTTLNAGGLNLGASNKLADSSNIIVNGGRFDLLLGTGAVETVANVTVTGGYISGSGNVTLNKLNATNGFNFQNADNAISANLGGGNITKTTGGTVTLSGNNTNTGGLTVDGGTLILSKKTSLYGGVEASWIKSKITVNSGGTLTFSIGGATDFSTANVTTLLANLTGDVTDGGFKGGSTLGLSVSTAASVADAIADTTGTGGGVISLYKAGTTLTLTGNNTYTGDTTISAGSLTISAGGRLGGGNYAGNIINNGILNLATGTTQTLSGNISGTGGLTNGTGQVITLSGDNSYSGGATLSTSTFVLGHKNAFGTGTVAIGASQAPLISAGVDLSGANAIANNVAMNSNFLITGSNNMTLSGILTLNGNRMLTVSNTAATVLSGPIHLSDGVTSGTLTLTAQTGSGPLTVSGLIDEGAAPQGLKFSFTTSALIKLSNVGNSYTGATEGIGTATGNLEISKLANGGSVSSIGASTSDASNLILSADSTLRYVGIGDTTDRLFTVSGVRGGINSSGSGALNFTNNGSIAYGAAGAARTLTLTGTNTGANTLTPTIANNGVGGIVSLSKTGTGNWILAGSNTYNGTTTVGTTGGADEGTLELSGLGKISNAATTVYAGNLDLGTTTQAITTLGLGAGASGTAANVLIGSGGVLNLGGTLTYTATNNPNGATISGAGTLNLNGNRTLNVNDSTAASVDLTISSIIADGTGANSINKAQAGTLVLGGNNSYTGGTTLTLGTLGVSHNNALGTGALTLSGTVTLQAVNNEVVLPNDITGGLLAFTVSGSQNLTVNGTFTGSSGIFTNNIGPGKLLTLGNMAIGTGNTKQTVIMTGTGDTAVIGTIADGPLATTGQSISVRSTGITTFSGNNTYSNATSITAGATLVITNVGNANTANSLGMSSNAAASLTLANATLKYTGAAASTDRLFSISGAADGDYATLDASGTGAIDFTNAGALGYGTPNQTRTLNLTGTNTGNNTLAALLLNNGTGDVSLNKSGAGTWVLSGNNTYTGATTVSAGTLLVNGSTSSSSSVNVSSNGTLGGNGTVGGSVSVYGILSPGNSIDTLNTGALSLTSTSTLSIELGRSGVTPVSDRTNVTGTVTLASGANLDLTLYTGLDNPVANDIFFLISNDGLDPITGVFTKLNGSDQVLNQGSSFSWNSQSWTITYEANFEGTSFTGGHDLAIQVVPEPATWALLAFSLTTVMILRRRRRD